MIAHTDHEIYAWLEWHMEYSGSFLRSFATAALRADKDNYEIIRPSLVALKEKYPVKLHEPVEVAR